MKIRTTVQVAVIVFSSARLLPQNAPLENSVFRSTGNDLVADCTGTLNKQAQCLKYIEGVVDGWTIALKTSARVNKAQNENNMCIPKGVTAGNLQKVVLRYADEHPEQLYREANIIVTLAIGNAFPCR
jgi:hypothetical protein